MHQPDSTAPAGLVNLHKPSGMSSAHYVYRLRPVFGIRKVGHAGTLDPFATGVLLACVGRATKLVERLMDLPKRYRTTIRLDVTNETFDTERPFLPVPGARPPPFEEVRAAVAGLVGSIEQTPPVFSAIKIDGRRSYEHARAGRAVTPRPRRVRIDRISILDYRWPRLSLDIECGRGTYIRAIARDLGRRLECGGCCESLTRTAVGPFLDRDAVDLTTSDPETVRSALQGMPAVIDRLRAYAPPASG